MIVRWRMGEGLVWWMLFKGCKIARGSLRLVL